MLESCIFVIFGATGDLTHRKLMPALYRLYVRNELPKSFAVVGVARKDKTHDDFRQDVKKSMAEFLPKEKFDRLDKFLSGVFYYRNDFDTADSYAGLKKFLEDTDKKYRTAGNRIFYLATLPDKFEPIIKNLRKQKFLAKGKDHRLIIEKPFGDDLKSARKLNKIINTAFRENQIFRIDHYLGKEAVQNLFALRFANKIFEPAWGERNIENVQITLLENTGIGTRGGFYDRYGAIKDVMQNHMMQILSLIAMSPPKNFNPGEVKDSKVKVLREISIPKKNDIVIGQYRKGALKGSVDYKDEEGVAKDSRTETFAAIKFCINNERWKGVPFYLKTGKNLDRKLVQIIVYFRNTSLLSKFSGGIHPNALIIKLFPDEGIYLRMNIKTPGNNFEIENVSMDFCHSCLFVINTPEAYEKLLHDIFLGDPTLFTRWDEVEAAWKVIDPVIAKKKKIRLHYYSSGSPGPEAADRLVKKNGHHWGLEHM